MIEANYYKSNLSQKSDNLQIYQIQKKIEDIKRLLAKNLQYQAKLKELRDKAYQRLKKNQILEKSFKKTKKRLQNTNRQIVTVSLYDFNYEQKKSQSLLNCMMLQNFKVKQKNFLKNIFEQVDYDDITLRNYVSKTQKLQQIAKRYPNNPKIIPFQQIGSFYKTTGIQVYKHWRKLNINQQQRNKLTEQQNKKILKYYFWYQQNWVQISMHMEGRTPQQLYYRYHKYLNPLIKKGRWNSLENLKLIILVEYYGAGNWYEISKKLKTRTDVQIRERFCNVLDPKLRQNSWSEQQQRLLMIKADEYKYCWSKISIYFENKTDNEIWRKYRNILGQKSEKQIQQIVKNEELKNKIILYKRKTTKKQEQKQKQKSQSTEPKDIIKKRLKLQIQK